MASRSETRIGIPARRRPPVTKVLIAAGFDIHAALARAARVASLEAKMAR